MKIKIILFTIYMIAAGLVLLAGVLFPQVRDWSHWAACACGIHAILALVVAFRNISIAGRIAAWFWQAISALICVILLLLWNSEHHNGWLLGAFTVGCFTFIVTLVFCLVMKPEEAATFHKKPSPMPPI